MKTIGFFEKLFQIKNKSILKHCIRCDEFLTTDKHESVHNFLKHYDEGKKILFKDKPIDILRFPGLVNIKISIISLILKRL